MSRQDNMLNYRKRRIVHLPSIDDVKVIPDIKVKSNIYVNENYPTELSFKVVSGKNDEMVVKLGMEGPFEKKYELPSATVLDGGAVTVNLPNISDIFGVFYLDVTVEDKEGVCVCEQTIPFSHVRVGKGRLNKCGCNTHMIAFDREHEEYPFCFQTFDTLSLFGAGLVRDEMHWRLAEYEKGVYEFLPSYMELTDYALERGIHPHLILDYGNVLYDDGKSPITEEGYQAFANFCGAVAKHLKGKVYHYEVWNEYNSPFSREEATPETYAITVKAVSKAMKAVDPDIKIFAGATSGAHGEWIRRMLSYDLYDYIDGVSFHHYCLSTYPDENQGELEKNAQKIRDTMSKYGEPKPIWVSETGWSVWNDQFSLGREEQAAALTRLFAITETSDVLDKVTMYDLRNDRNNPLGFQQNWGMIEFNDSIVPYCLKESAAAVCCLNFMIGDAEYVKKVVEKNIKNTIYNKDGQTINALWSLDGRKKVTFNLSDSCDIYDMYGTLVKSGVASGEYTTELNENPVYFIGGEVTVKESVKPDEIYYDFPYSISAVPVLKEDGWYVKALVKNHSRVLQGKIRVEMPELRKDSGYKNFALKEGQSDFVEVKVGDVDFKKLYRALLEINLWSGEHYTTCEQVSFLEVPYGEFVEFTLDMDDYTAMYDHTPIEAKANVKMSYTEESLILKVDVEEETHIQYGQAGDNWKDLWDGDGIELMIQPIYDGHKDITRYNHIGLALSSFTGEKVPYVWNGVSNGASRWFFNCIFDAERKGNITSYVAEFKWRDILPPNVEFSDCDSFGFSLKVNKTDDPEDIKGYLSLYRGIGWWKPPYNNAYTPLEFGRFVLGGKK